MAALLAVASVWQGQLGRAVTVAAAVSVTFLMPPLSKRPLRTRGVRAPATTPQAFRHEEEEEVLPLLLRVAVLSWGPERRAFQ